MKSYFIVGGGFFGLYLASYLSSISRGGVQVRVFEKENSFMSHASYNNQARVHNGYHYPRSVLTALRSRVSFPRFIKEFPTCVYSDFDKYYMVGKPLGKVTAKQFYQFCLRIGADIAFAPTEISKLTNPQHIEAVFKTKEFAFDAHKLRDAMLERLSDRVSLNLGTEVIKVEQGNNKELIVTVRNKEGNIESFVADQVFNCTYSRINAITSKSGLEIIPLKHEMTEMCLVDVPEEIKHLGITVMCGPFFSVMPFPSVTHNGQVVHSFSHVRYTPHYEWYDSKDYLDGHFKLKNDQKHSAWEYMRKDSARYMPILNECRYLSSLWEVKTVLPRSETDDSRPILCRFNYGLKGFHCIMGGKIDNVYDAITAIHDELGL